MPARVRVSRQVRVVQGRQEAIFEMVPRGLSITLIGGATGFVLKPPGIDALVELLIQDRKVERVKAAIVKYGTDDIEKRFTREGAPDTSPAREDTTSTPEGLTRSEDGIEGGMQE